MVLRSDRALHKHFLAKPIKKRGMMKGLPSQQNDNKRRRADKKRARRGMFSKIVSTETTPRVKRRKSAYRLNRDVVIWELLQKFSYGKASDNLWGEKSHPFFTRKARDKYLRDAAKRVDKTMKLAGRRASATFLKHVFA